LALVALGGSLDAYTGREHTSYQARVLDEHLTHAADVIADIVFRPLIRGADLALEKKVVLEEIAMVEDTPDDLIFDIHNEVLWGEHPYGFAILGTRETVSGLRVADLRALHEGAYHPANIVVVATGNVRHEALLDVLEQTGWGAIDARAAGRAEAPTPPAPHLATRHVAREGAQTHIVMGTDAVRQGDSRRLPLALLSMLLGGGMSSRLFQRVREELGLAYTVFTHQVFHADAGAHGVYVATAPATAADAFRVIREELASIAALGLPEEEVMLGKQQLKGQVTLSMESVSARMYRGAGVELYGEPYRTLDQMLAEIEGISSEVLRSVAGEFFPPERRTVVSMGPAGV
jgi:predicted Zn-dependent peptidase